MQLSFEWNGTESVAEYAGYRVRAIHDDSPENPWEAWDCQPPLIVNSDRRITVYRDISDPLRDVSDSWINRHWRALSEAVSESPEVAAEYKSDYGYSKMADARRDLLAEWLDGLKGYHRGDYLEALRAICELRGWPSVLTSSQDYSQRDYAELLLVFTPEYAKEIGAEWPRTKAAKDKARESLKRDAELWGFWAWGDVYGYSIESADGECLDSCFGFYGDNFAKSGLAEAAASALEYIIDAKRAARTAKAKELIKARVPLALRAAILESV